MIRKLRFVVVALVVAAVAAPFAQAKSDPGFAQAYLQQLGLTPAEASAWTTGVCSYSVKPSSCELSQGQARAASVGLAQALLGHTGLTSGQVDAWIRGVCSYKDKPASCYLTPAEARMASERLAESLGTPPGSAVEVVARGGFDWGDALIGAAVATGVLLIGSAGAMGLRHRREPARV
jgi:hypothetical protein